ncbi:50S ribosomal protein L5 [candidate division Kazan bacterium RIFCSPHIGHO2_01_FULL_49_10]|uniref:Large ribosomal subunit protein uL5 n=1 Tax=candidate division Kazan bacterium RIFCSPLOWO2_01_FULL_48_13 TaxID=1798539 RepID=A0A1F4PPN7_UNCK3|nr:MAG: 50S ribosomal protein L5 [candidate division Kazan bacterium RIFCSPHIGHO2_01_FULL_49_10]OGB85647.1 MAG: 50S ribosomal protein L5 [candidate division Kazan bacterium RIFCSPLOWO2_01_FULL_48_13]
MATFKDQYQAVRRELKEELGLKSVEAAPRIIKVNLNVGAGAALNDGNYIEKIITDLRQIAGQQPIITKAKQSIAGFKLREGAPIGVAVTLRGNRMFDFLSRLVNVALPRVRDFQGIPPTGFDGHGNYTLGIKEHVVFPEISLENVEKTFGLSITIATNAGQDDLARALLAKLRFPFKQQ